MQHRTIGFIGAGNMARAVIAGLVKAGYPAELIRVSAPSATRREALVSEFAVKGYADNVQCAQQSDVVVLAIKPQMMAAVCQALQQPVDFSRKLVISIAAGITLERFYALLGASLNMVRVMPNTPSLVGWGMSGLYAPPQVSREDRHFTEVLMKSVGEVCWVEAEAGINSVIAAAGSAPAYFFLFMEAIQQQAERLGFDRATARLLVQQTANGAAALAAASPDTSFATLREQVTSKGGTTAEALRVLQQHQLADVVAEAMQAAIKRAQEMEKLF